jgi:hypothetical protein
LGSGGPIVEDAQNLIGRLCLCQLFADRFVVQKFGNRGKRTEMNLKLILWHNKQDDESDRRIVQ